MAQVTTIRIRTAAAVYGALAIAAVAIGVFRDNPDIYHHPDGIFVAGLPLPLRLFLSGIAGILFGLGVSWLTRFSVYRFTWSKNLHMEFRGLLGPLRNLDILAFALFSSVAEEMFFRGALQPLLGISITSLVFGLLHIAPGRKFLPWPFQAVVMGFALGGLFWITGDLLCPVLAHFTINYQNLHFINRYDPSLQMPKSFTSDISGVNQPVVRTWADRNER